MDLVVSCIVIILLTCSQINFKSAVTKYPLMHKCDCAKHFVLEAASPHNIAKL